MDEMDRLFRKSDFSAENKELGKCIWNRFTHYNAETVSMPVNINEITKEMIQKAMQCKDADELIVLAKNGGVELKKEEAEAYMAEFADFELDEETLKNVAGGACWNCLDDCGGDTCPCRD